MAKHHFPVGGTISDGTAVVINEVELGFLTQLAGWRRFREAANHALGTHSLSVPEDYRVPVRQGGTMVWRIAPNRVLIRSDAKLSFESSDELVALDLSDARVCLTLEGAGAASLLSRVIALDFSNDKFPVGTFAQTALHHIGVLVDRQGPDRFTVLIPTTWATSLTGLLIDHVANAA
jgi:heterotetrameric sarcosine oxidase gamma subunit